MTTTADLDQAQSEEYWRKRGANFADTIEAHRAVIQDEIEARDRSIVEAIDLGWPRRKVALWNRVSEARITGIVADRCAQ